MAAHWKMPIHLYTAKIRLTVIRILYKQTLFIQYTLAFVVSCDLEMQITVIINNYDHDQLEFITQDTQVLAVYY